MQAGEEDSHVDIAIVTGSILDQQVQIIVNSTTKELNLADGNLTSVILAAAGSTIQDECRKAHPWGINSGEIAVTSAGKLKFHRIFHGALCPPDTRDSHLLSLRTMMKNCLVKAKEERCNSIAFPVLGIGRLKYPIDIVAKEMFRAVTTYAKRCGIKYIVFVLPEDNAEILSIFKEMENTTKKLLQDSQDCQPEFEVILDDCKVKIAINASNKVTMCDADVVFRKPPVSKHVMKINMKYSVGVKEIIINRDPRKWSETLYLPLENRHNLYEELLPRLCYMKIMKFTSFTVHLSELEKEDDCKSAIGKVIEVINVYKLDPGDLEGVMIIISDDMLQKLTPWFEENVKAPSRKKSFKEKFSTGVKSFLGFKINITWKKLPATNRDARLTNVQITGTDRNVVMRPSDAVQSGFRELTVQMKEESMKNAEMEEVLYPIPEEMGSHDIQPSQADSFEKGHGVSKVGNTTSPKEIWNILKIFTPNRNIKISNQVTIDDSVIDYMNTIATRFSEYFIKEFDILFLNGSSDRAPNTSPKETLFTNLKDINRDEVSIKDDRGATYYQMNTGKHCMESSTPVEESRINYTSLNSVSELEFRALQIIDNRFENVGVHTHISWHGDSVEIWGSPASSLYAKKHLTKLLMVLRTKQLEEIFLDEEEKKIVQDVIEEVQSEDTICVYNEKMNQVVVYSDKQDDIRKFKHKLKLQTGKVKESGRSRQRFAENSPLLEEYQENFDSLQKSTDIQQELSLSNNDSEVEVFYTKENIKVSVYKANILNLPVDCIVNDANDTLQHRIGVAKVIADAAGSELIQQGNAIIMKNRNGKIPVGFQVTTSAGRLPYRWVIHTVGPCWADYEPHNLQKVKDCEEDMYRAIFGCFLEAEKYGLSSIALPAVGSGIYAVPQEMCAVQYAKAVLDYSRNSRQGLALKEIHFIDKLPHLVKLIQDTFRTMIQNGKVPNYNIQNYVASSLHYHLKQSKDTGWKEHGKEDITADNSQNQTPKLKELSPFHYESEVQHTKQFVFQVSARPVVCIYKGDILKVKNMDAVVCPDDIKGLGIGTIAVGLGMKTKYRKLKEKCFERQKPDLGDVVITSGEENSFNIIVHVVIKTNYPQKPEFMSTMKKSIDNILRKTNEWENVKTIALPLFGVELLTEKSWAELFLERFVAFCCEVKNPNLEEVHIITHFASKTAYLTVKKVFIEFSDMVNKTQLQEKKPPPKLLLPKNSRTSDHKKNDEGVDMVYQLDEKGSNARLQNKEDESAVELMKDLSLKEGGKRVSPSMSQSKMPLPSHWTSMKVTDVLQVPLDPKDTEAVIRDEYSMVKQDFDKTMSHAEIVSIKRIQNALLWEHYTLQKKEMEIKAGVGLANEMHLYHGTTPDAVDLICHSNFDFRMAGEWVGALLGQGAYFASNAKYSDCYAVTDDKNHKFMFVAKVLVGKTCLGNPDFKKPPYLDDNDKKRGTYNTCVNNVSNPTVYCVFDRNQYYPEYLVEYTL